MTLLLLWGCAECGADVEREHRLCSNCLKVSADLSAAEEVREARRQAALLIETGEDAYSEAEQEWHDPDWLLVKLEAAQTATSAWLWQANGARAMDARSVDFRPFWLSPLGDRQLHLMRMVPWATADPLVVLCAHRVLRFWHRKRMTGWPEEIDIDSDWWWEP